MINPSFHVQDEIYIHAASQSVWQIFSKLHHWPRWNSEVLAAQWLSDDSWHEGSTFELRHKSLFGSETTTKAILRMCVPGDTVVWESQGAGMTVVNSASFADDIGGCKLTARHTYHGLATFGLRIIKGRQQANLRQAMLELKQYVEHE